MDIKILGKDVDPEKVKSLSFNHNGERTNSQISRCYVYHPTTGVVCTFDGKSEKVKSFILLVGSKSALNDIGEDINLDPILFFILENSKHKIYLLKPIPSEYVKYSWLFLYQQSLIDNGTEIEIIDFD